ncbi:MAG: hypothetical protein QOE54_5221, partial [Streptosporangiaceae bacterium]|nr:hypothetical protein [Streptosporangiaceae bacterium]
MRNPRGIIVPFFVLAAVLVTGCMTRGAGPALHARRPPAASGAPA